MLADIGAAAALDDAPPGRLDLLDLSVLVLFRHGLSLSVCHSASQHACHRARTRATCRAISARGSQAPSAAAASTRAASSSASAGDSQSDLGTQVMAGWLSSVTDPILLLPDADPTSVGLAALGIPSTYAAADSPFICSHNCWSSLTTGRLGLRSPPSHRATVFALTPTLSASSC